MLKTCPNSLNTTRQDFAHEDALRARKVIARICGVDEAGRGPLAGPVVAGAALLPRDVALEFAGELNDSKKLKPARARAFERANPPTRAVGIGFVRRRRN